MRKAGELETMFKEIGLGSDKERQVFLKFIQQDAVEQVVKEQIIIRLGTTSKPKEDKGDA